jgi:hypothetical protein
MRRTLLLLPAAGLFAVGVVRVATLQQTPFAVPSAQPVRAAGHDTRTAFASAEMDAPGSRSEVEPWREEIDCTAVEPPAPVHRPMALALADFWGARWPQVRAELEADGLNLDQLGSLKDWDESRELLSRRILDEFTDPADCDRRLHAYCGVGDPELQFSDLYSEALARGATRSELESRVAKYDTLKSTCKADFLAFRAGLAAVAQQRLLDPGLLRAPFSIPRSMLPEAKPLRFHLNKGFASGDWSLSLVIYEGDDAALDALWAQFLASAGAWREAVSFALSN